MVSPALSSWWGIAGLMELKREIRVRTSTSLSSFLPVRDPHQRLLSRAAETQRKLFKAPWCQTESSGILSLLCYGTKDTQPKFSEVISKLTVLPCPPPPPRPKRVSEWPNDNLYMKNNVCLKKWLVFQGCTVATLLSVPGIGSQGKAACSGGEHVGLIVASSVTQHWRVWMTHFTSLVPGVPVCEIMPWTWSCLVAFHWSHWESGNVNDLKSVLIVCSDPVRENYVG